MIWKIECNAYKMGFGNDLSLGFDFGWNILKELAFEAYVWFGFPIVCGALLAIFYDYLYLEYLTGRCEHPVVFVLDLDIIFKGLLYYILII